MQNYVLGRCGMWEADLLNVQCPMLNIEY